MGNKSVYIVESEVRVGSSYTKSVEGVFECKEFAMAFTREMFESEAKAKSRLYTESRDEDNSLYLFAHLRYGSTFTKDVTYTCREYNVCQSTKFEQ